jgi:hypothetical protein
MKLGELSSIAHNLADSLTSGWSSLFESGGFSVFAEAAGNPNRYIEVDVLKGEVIDGAASQELRDVLARSEAALSILCQRHGTSPDAFRQLTVRYISDAEGDRFIVTVENEKRRVRRDEYLAHGMGWGRKKKDRPSSSTPEWITSHWPRLR